MHEEGAEIERKPIWSIKFGAIVSKCTGAYHPNWELPIAGHFNNDFWHTVS